MNRSTLLLLKTRLKYSAQQLCVIMNGVLIGFKLRPSHGTTFFDDRLEKKSAVGEVATAISSEMEAEDYALGGIDGTVDSPRLRLALLDKHANRTLNFLSGEVKLNYLQLKLVAQSVPYLLATPADSVLRPRLRFLEGRLNFSTAQLTRSSLPRRRSSTALRQPCSAELGFLEMRPRLTRPQVRKIGGWTDRWLLFLFLFCLIVSSDCVRLLPLSLVCSSRARATPRPPILRTEAATTTTTTRVTGWEELPPTTAPTELTAEALNEILRHLQSVLDSPRRSCDWSFQRRSFLGCRRRTCRGRSTFLRRMAGEWLLFVGVCFLNRAPLFAHSCSFLPTPAFCRRSGSHRTTFRRSSWACRACCWPTLRTS